MKVWIGYEKEGKNPIKDHCGLFSGKTKNALLGSLVWTEFEDNTRAVRCSLEKEGEGKTVFVVVDEKGKPYAVHGYGGYMIGTRKQVELAAADHIEDQDVKVEKFVLVVPS